MVKIEDFKAKYGEYINGVSSEKVYYAYYEKIKPVLPVISHARANEKPKSEKIIRLSLGVGVRVWNVCKEVFEDLKDSLESKESYMDLKAQYDLQKGIEETEYKNAKLIDMQLLRYDKDYKPKGGELVQEQPKIQITISDERVSDEELEKEFDNNFKI